MCIEYARAPAEQYTYLLLRLLPFNAIFVRGVGVEVGANFDH